MSLSFAANLVFAVLLYTYAIALALAWRSSRRAVSRERRGFRSWLVVLGAVVGEQL